MGREAEGILEKLTLMDDMFMGKFFEGQPRCAEEVVRAILGKPSLKVRSVRTKHELVSLQARSVQLDILATTTWRSPTPPNGPAIADRAWATCCSPARTRCARRRRR